MDVGVDRGGEDEGDYDEEDIDQFLYVAAGLSTLQ